MTIRQKKYYKQIDNILDAASEEMSAEDYIELCEEIETNASARAKARRTDEEEE